MMIDTNQIEEICREKKWCYCSFNGGRHIRITNGIDDMKGDYVSWWPQSGRFVKNDRWNSATFHHTVEGTVEATEMFFKWRR